MVTTLHSNCSRALAYLNSNARASALLLASCVTPTSSHTPSGMYNLGTGHVIYSKINVAALLDAVLLYVVSVLVLFLE
jgi:hypothetical protein